MTAAAWVGVRAKWAASPNFAPALVALENSTGSAAELASDESLWRPIASAFAVDRTIVNLNTGGVAPAPKDTFEAYVKHLRHANGLPYIRLWKEQWRARDDVRRELSELIGCDTDELALLSNTSEALETCQFGLDLAPGDEVLCTDQEYPRMLTTFRQRERRNGIKLRTVEIPVPLSDPTELVRRYTGAMNERTKLVLCCHVVSQTGQVLPVRDIARAAHARGIRVLVDGAHGFGQFPFRLADLECDAYATSLHKWMHAPIGTGFLYVRRDWIPDIWPMYGAREEQKSDIKKFEEQGTLPQAGFLALHEAMMFQRAIGIERKAARLAYLRDIWATPLAAEKNVSLLTDLGPGRSYAIASFDIEGVERGQLRSFLHRNHIEVSSTDPGGRPCIRVSPSIANTREEVEHFRDVMLRIARKGLPA